MKFFYKYCLYLLTGIIMAGCGPYKHMPDNSYLLNDVKLKVEKRSGLKEELYQNITQKPNKKFLGLKFHMFLYNLSNPEKEKGYFKKIGEEPVVWDSYQTKRSKDNLLMYLKQNGYFRATVEDSVSYKSKRKVDVTYFINPGKPYRIKNFSYEIEDSVIYMIVKEDSVNNMIKTGERFKVSELISEKKRVQKLLLNHGYYDFIEEDIKNFITYEVDTSLDKLVNITMVINQPDPNEDKIERFYKYRINDVYIFRNYQPMEFLNKPDYLIKDVDTILYDDIYFLSKHGVKTRPGILEQSNYIMPNELYSYQDENLTIKHLRSLGIFKNVEMDFEVLEDSLNSNRDKLMNCYINLIPSLRQFMQFDVAATNSSGNIGAEASVRYQYKNLFGNAEVLDVTFRGAADNFFREDTKNTIGNSRSFDVETKFHIPKFLIPFKTERFIKKYSPRTTTALSFKYFERDSFYNQNIVNISFGYGWRGNRYTIHSVNPVNLNFVNIIIDDSARFNDLLQSGSDYKFENFRDKMITTANYSFEYNNEGRRRNRDFVYLRYNLELGGNLLYVLNKSFNKDTSINVYRIFNVPFSQFLRTDIDFRYYDYKTSSQSLVYRVFIGIAKPYGNSESVPYEKRYFCGGPNGIRAWLPYFLGPGTTYDLKKRYWFNGSSDIKLEFNAEYRFDIFWKLEGALFIDAGNVWSLSKDQSEDAQFNFKSFYKELGVGSGFGIRLDLDYFIGRLDWALKIHDPSKFNGESDYPWIFRKDKVRKNDFAFQFGITYPF